MLAYDSASLRIIAARKRDVLAKLQMISDARAGQPVQAIREIPVGQRRTRTSIPGVNGGKGHADSAPPPDVDMECVGKEGPPPKTFSLYAHYLWRFEAATADVRRASQAGDEHGRIRAILRIDSLCSMALRDLLLYGSRSLPVKGGGGKMAPPRSDSDAENVKRLLAEYVGVPAHEVAVWEMTSVAWVRRSRRLAGVDPELGEERADERTTKALQMRESGASQGAIARELGVSQQRVSQILAAA